MQGTAAIRRMVLKIKKGCPKQSPVRTGSSARLSFMRLGMVVLTLLLSGCQALPLLKPWEGSSSPSVMPLWERYRQCLVASEPTELLRIVDQIELVMFTGPEPPPWLKSWGGRVMRQPLRTAVDPQALGVACAIRAARIMAEQARVPEALALYRRVVSRYTQPEWAYYYEQARAALASLPIDDGALIASSLTPASSHTH